MAIFGADANPNAYLAKVATGTRWTMCSAQPANFAGIAAVALADVAVTAGDGNGDYTIADGDTSGRKLTFAQQDDVAVDSTGTATHLAIDDGTTLLFVTTTPSTLLTSGNTVNFLAWTLEVRDPVAA